MEQEENKEESPDHNPGISVDEADTSRNETSDNVPLYEEEEEDPEERRKRRKEKKRKKREKRRLQEQQREEEERTDVQPQTDPYEDVIGRRKEEEDRIKRSWVQQMSVQNRVSPEPQENPPTNPPENTLYRQTLQTSAPRPVLAERGMEAHEMSSTGGEQRPGGHRVPTKHYKEVIIGAGGEDDEGDIGCCGWILTGLSILIVVLSIPFSIFFCLKVVQEYERAVIFRLGRLLSGGAKGPGIFFVLPCIENYTKVDLRTVSFDVPPQEILTRDSVTVSVDAVVYYRISNPTVSVANVENAHHATRLLAQTTLRNILGTKNMSEILGDREAISNAMQNMLDDATDRWGIKVERVEIKDVRLPIQLQRAMAAEAEASREARAKLLAAEGEHKASRALKEAADIINQSPAALQLRYLQTLNSISSEKNSTIIFPLPIDLVSMFMRK